VRPPDLFELPDLFEAELLDFTKRPLLARAASRAWEPRLPAIKTMATGILPPAEGKADDPDHEEDNCGNPQKMDREPGPEENQDEQQGEKKHHENNPFLTDQK
jgi:hypothetical protein